MAENNQFLQTTTPGQPQKGSLLFWTREQKADHTALPERTFRAIQRGPVYDHTIIAPPTNSTAPAPAPIIVSEATKVWVGCNQLYIEEVEIDVIEPGIITIKVVFNPPGYMTPPNSPPPSSSSFPPKSQTSSNQQDVLPPHPEDVYKRDRYIMVDEKRQLFVGHTPQSFRVDMISGRQVLMSTDGGHETAWRDRGLDGWHMDGSGDILWCKLLKRDEDQRGSRKAPGWRPGLEWLSRE